MQVLQLPCNRWQYISSQSVKRLAHESIIYVMNFASSMSNTLVTISTPIMGSPSFDVKLHRKIKPFNLPMILQNVEEPENIKQGYV